VVEPDGQWFTVSFGNVFVVQYVGGASPGSETLSVEVYDGIAGIWSAASSLTATTAAPVVTNPTGNQQTLVAPLANTTVEGGGYDILDLSHNPIATASSAYTEASNHNGTFALTTIGSSDLVSGVMQVQFSDRTVTVEASSSQGEYIALLYQGAPGRTPDAALGGWEKIAAALPPAATQALGIAYVLSDTSGGYNGNLSVAAGFTNSAEFSTKYGSLTNAQFVTQLYSNILDRAPDTAGFNGWISELSSGPVVSTSWSVLPTRPRPLPTPRSALPVRVAPTRHGCS